MIIMRIIIHRILQLLQGGALRESLVAIVLGKLLQERGDDAGDDNEDASRSSWLPQPSTPTEPLAGRS